MLFGPERGQRNRMLHVPAARVKQNLSLPAGGTALSRAARLFVGENFRKSKR